MAAILGLRSGVGCNAVLAGNLADHIE